MNRDTVAFATRLSPSSQYEPIGYVYRGDCHTMRSPKSQPWDMEKAERIYRMARGRDLEDVDGFLRDRFKLLAEEREAQSQEDE